MSKIVTLAALVLVALASAACDPRIDQMLEKDKSLDERVAHLEESIAPAPTATPDPRIDQLVEAVATLEKRPIPTPDPRIDHILDEVAKLEEGVGELEQRIASSTPIPRYTLSASTLPMPGQGQVQVSPAPDSDGNYAAGTVVQLTAGPSVRHPCLDTPYWAFTQWSGDVTGSNPTVSITIDSDKNVIAMFQEFFPPPCITPTPTLTPTPTSTLTPTPTTITPTPTPTVTAIPTLTPTPTPTAIPTPVPVPEKTSPEGNIAANPSRSGYPSPLGSDSGWGGGAKPWEIVDGVRTYPEWYHGLAFTGGRSGYQGACGWRQATIDFGEPRTFDKVVVWHHGLEHVPNTYKIQYWDGTSWVDIISTTEGHSYLLYPTDQPKNWWESGSTPTENTFDPVTSSKVRIALENCDIVHGWIYEIEVYEPIPG